LKISSRFNGVGRGRYVPEIESVVMLLRFRVLHRRDPVFAFQHFVQNYRQTDHHDDETTGLLLRSHVAPFDLEVDLLRCACFLNEAKGRYRSKASSISLPFSPSRNTPSTRSVARRTAAAAFFSSTQMSRLSNSPNRAGTVRARLLLIKKRRGEKATDQHATYTSSHPIHTSTTLFTPKLQSISILLPVPIILLAKRFHIL
jgi:hypothetical protein